MTNTWLARSRTSHLVPINIELPGTETTAAEETIKVFEPKEDSKLESQRSAPAPNHDEVVPFTCHSIREIWNEHVETFSGITI